MSKRNPCKRCIHYEWCRGRTLCNTFVAKEELSKQDAERTRGEKDYREYAEAYEEYVEQTNN